ncbi:aspartate/glutamate racemase family protein [Rhizobium sp. CC-YZS058]|uniref:aspartate/glutamate racemase family protein n=1 Tax=Rhizobium sp. CC-YZS058 TaxID=3042153 RepID=UPI002B061A8E|nr:aspartate/glutamate racemase family protein [Rhizobium sp. CC-YZS058]MEA3537098.1 aspartate/glutamate racemase family protein [Rhizobium sp. CC-YZS058]
MATAPRIALIHATSIAIDPIKASFEKGWPEAQTINILEDSLSPDRADVPSITDELAQRILLLAEYAIKSRSDAILFTCSSFGSAIEAAAAQLPVPVLKPNEAMFEAAIGQGGRTAMLYTFPPAKGSMEVEFHEEAARKNPSATIESFLVDGAIDAVRNGDIETHNRLVSEAASALTGYDAIMLAHFSTARAIERVRTVTATPVFSSPDAAVAKLRNLLA